MADEPATPPTEGNPEPWQSQITALQETVSQLALSLQEQNTALTESLAGTVPKGELEALKNQLAETRQALEATQGQLSEALSKMAELSPSSVVAALPAVETPVPSVSRKVRNWL